MFLTITVHQTAVLLAPDLPVAPVLAVVQDLVAHPQIHLHPAVKQKELVQKGGNNDFFVDELFPVFHNFDDY